MASRSMADQQRKGFDDRILRIAQGGPNTTGTIYLGATEADGAKIPPKKRRARRGGSPALAVLTWPLALAIGALCMLAGRVALYQFQARPEFLEMVPPQHLDLLMLTADVGVAFVLALTFAWAFRLGGGMRRVFLAAGFIGVMMGEGLIIERAPDLFVPLFSESYVSAAVSGTSPIETVDETLDQFSRSSLLLPQFPPRG